MAFLAAVTVAVVLIHSGLRSDDTPKTTVTGPAATTALTGTSTRTTTGKQTTQRFYTVASGDTFGSIAGKTGISIERLSQLNPGISSNSLQVGQRLRVK